MLTRRQAIAAAALATLGISDSVAAGQQTPAAAFKPCTACGGKGQVREVCASCNGKGTPTCKTCLGSGKNPFNTAMLCVICNGKGTVDCFFCKGVGQKSVECLRCGRTGIDPDQ